MTIGIRFYSYPDHSGYGLAALAYVRALHNAGVPVWWTPLLYRQGKEVPWRREDGLDTLPIARGAEQDEGLRDLAALLEACGPRPYDTVLFHMLPEHWPRCAEGGKRNIGYTVWEADRLPVAWPPLLKLAEKILVPCEMNRPVFRRGTGRPVDVIPHIRRHVWNSLSSADAAAVRRELDIPDDHFVFLAISIWDPRKALADLVRVFSQSFCRADKVTLLLKTSAWIHDLESEAPVESTIAGFVQVLQEQVEARTGVAPARVAVVAADGLEGRAIDAMHAASDCFVSLTHGEGWGMGAFDAATLGKPVLIPAFGGPADFLPAHYPGRIAYKMVPVSGWSAGSSFQPPQRWAQADLADAARKMKAAVSRYDEWLEPAALVAEQILERYSEPVVARRLIAAIDD